MTEGELASATSSFIKKLHDGRSPKKKKQMLYAFFWVIPPASEFYMAMFPNILSVPSS
jgi:hypothetical protein